MRPRQPAGLPTRLEAQINLGRAIALGPGGDPSEGLKVSSAVEAQARRLGLKRIALEAKLAMSEIRARIRPGDRALIAGLIVEAESAGYLRIARQARAVR